MWYLILNGRKYAEAFAFAQPENIEKTARKLLTENYPISTHFREATPSAASDQVRYFYVDTGRYGVPQVVARPVEGACEGVDLLK